MVITIDPYQHFEENYWSWKKFIVIIKKRHRWFQIQHRCWWFSFLKPAVNDNESSDKESHFGQKKKKIFKFCCFFDCLLVLTTSIFLEINSSLSRRTKRTGLCWHLYAKFEEKLFRYLERCSYLNHCRIVDKHLSTNYQFVASERDMILSNWIICTYPVR